MEIVVCSCLSCKHEIGKFQNSWDVYGSNYYSPLRLSLTSESENGLLATGEIRETNFGKDGTSCYLQDLVCKSCKSYLGIRCDSAPQGHILRKDQQLLRLANMSCFIAGTSEVAIPHIENRIPLSTDSSKKSKKAKGRASTVQPSSTRSHSLVPQPGESPQQGLMLPPPLKIPSTEPSEFEQWARKAINSQKTDIARISSSVERIENTVQSVQKLMEEIKKQQAVQKRQIEKNVEDVKPIVNDLRTLDERMISADKQHLGALDDLANAWTKELDTFSEEMGKIGGKAGEVDDLKSEVERLKERLGQLEAATVEKKKVSEEIVLQSAKKDIDSQATLIGTSSQPNSQTKSRHTRLLDGVPSARVESLHRSGSRASNKSGRRVRPAKTAASEHLEQTSHSQESFSNIGHGRSFLRVEISPIQIGHEVDTTFYEHPTTFSQEIHSRSQHNESNSASKRKRRGPFDDSHMDQSEEESSYELPTKKRRQVTRQEPTAPSATRNGAHTPQIDRIVTDISSTDNESSSPDSKHNLSKNVQNESLVTIKAPVPRRLTRSSIIPPTSSNNTISSLAGSNEQATSSNPDPSTHTPPYQPTRATALRIETRQTRRPSSVPSLEPPMFHNGTRPRDQDGHLVLTNGKVDGRSLRSRSTIMPGTLTRPSNTRNQSQATSSYPHNTQNLTPDGSHTPTAANKENVSPTRRSLRQTELVTGADDALPELSNQLHSAHGRKTKYEAPPFVSRSDYPASAPLKHAIYESVEKVARESVVENGDGEESETDIEGFETEKRFRCEGCGRGYSSEVGLGNHYKSHPSCQTTSSHSRTQSRQQTNNGPSNSTDNLSKIFGTRKTRSGKEVEVEASADRDETSDSKKRDLERREQMVKDTMDRELRKR